MMEMNDLISRKWLMECVDEGWIKFDTEKDKNKFIHLVRDTAPSADVVEVVRCKDCKFGRYDIGDRGMYCGRKNVQLDTYEDDFCSFGERKDGEQDG